jgi:hypothetical protein
VSPIIWEQHHDSPDTWCVYYGEASSRWPEVFNAVRIAAVAPQPDADGYWQGVVWPRPDGSYPGIRIDHCPSRNQAMGVVNRELMRHWPEAVNAEHPPGDGSGA